MTKLQTEGTNTESRPFDKTNRYGLIACVAGTLLPLLVLAFLVWSPISNWFTSNIVETIEGFCFTFFIFFCIFWGPIHYIALVIEIILRKAHPLIILKILPFFIVWLILCNFIITSIWPSPGERDDVGGLFIESFLTIHLLPILIAFFKKNSIKFEIFAISSAAALSIIEMVFQFLEIVFQF